MIYLFLENSMNISVASYSFHGLLAQGKIDVFGYLESCKYRYQVQSADIWNGMLPSTGDDYLKKVKEGLDERELVLVNLCVDDAHIWEDDAASREQNYQNALAHLRAGEFLGAKTIRIDAGGSGDTFTEEQFDWIVKRFKEYAQRAYDNGYLVGPENHWGPETNPETMKRICQAVDSPAFGVLLHFRGNAGDAVMAPWAMHTHISWDIAHTCLEESLSTLQATGYQGYYGVEHHSAKEEYFKTAIQLGRIRQGLWEMRGKE
jgi:sugar phosphate isomerase/epimerase